ncbi:protein STRUBBELIG-RECEPTOR FAMILY 3 isoform X2 [Phoenix dactylifera]|uniref:Protein STRUBBELIG-RECEPTOR FAMILY 3 isoform X2 n=1 Tax=Phoenix dactylifera TaxID=42345 RepID=A0A8B8IZA9_PHODC|nr:protein STRUBBELIG-RECEPTOR FAMILY 3 isoform X2 [Phoenix dactylifera]
MLTVNEAKLRILLWVTVGFMVLFTMPFSQGYTNEKDVYAINNLYTALGSPPLPGWVASAGDPCFEVWQGVQCVESNITAIVLNDANLGGELGDKLANFTSITTIDLSNNHIGGNIPENLPRTMMQFFLSANQFTGSIPDSLSELTLLSDMSVNQNLLTGELPDAFQSLTGLINLDLSSNNLTGQLPPSMQNLSSLTALNIENNLFSGPIPEKLLSIPNFKKDGNPFNTSSAPSPMITPSPLPHSGAPSPETMPSNSSEGPSIHDNETPRKEKKVSVVRIIGYAVVAVIVLIMAVLLFMFCISKRRGRKQKHEEIPKRLEIRAHGKPKEPQINADLNEPDKEAGKVPIVADEKQDEVKINMAGPGALALPPLVDKVIVNPSASSKKNPRTCPENLNPPAPVKSYSAASLQQYTNSFSEESLIKDGCLGRIYLAEPPEGKLLAVLKLDNMNSNIQLDDFLELVLSISELRHPNILELVGYCAEFGQCLLVYNYFSSKTLHDILHSEDDHKIRLSWRARIQIAFEAAKALEYLHESCQPPVIHQNFEPSNIFLDDDLAVRVFECGLAPLMSSNSVTQLSGRIHALFSYEAPEFGESGSHSEQSDVYSFGVVMLELLTGRKPYDRSRPRAEQHLVRWASSQLHDINTLSRMVDPSIDGKYSVKSLSRFADIISRCIQRGPEFRPLMSEVVQDLARVIEDAMKNENGNPHSVREKRI